MYRWTQGGGSSVDEVDEVDDVDGVDGVDVKRRLL